MSNPHSSTTANSAPHPLATDEEDWSNDYPITEKYKDIYDDIVWKWRVTPLPAFDPNGKFIKAQNLEDPLKGSMVLVYFELKHYAIKNRKNDGIAGNTFSAIATQVKILERGTDRRPSPYKSQMLKGPRALPLASAKKKDQINAVKAFHPGKFLLLSGVRCWSFSSNFFKATTSTPKTETSSPSGSSSKKDRKKRAVDEEGEATASDDDGPSASKGAKKRKTQAK